MPTQPKTTLSPKERAQIELIEQIYQQFCTEMEKLQKKQNTLITSITQRIDHVKTEKILQQLKHL